MRPPGHPAHPPPMVAAEGSDPAFVDAVRLADRDDSPPAPTSTPLADRLGLALGTDVDGTLVARPVERHLPAIELAPPPDPVGDLVVAYLALSLDQRDDFVARVRAALAVSPPG